ncbi:MAG: ketopantoate reductase family protein [Pirellulaceae bacterium]|nr:ketopantoate reductase family protein [Pirellulaceae bacterium]
MKILIYGAGNIGSLYAAKLKESGNNVDILARGRRLREIREHGIRLQDFVSGEETTTRVEAVESLAPDDAYDLVLVILPRHRVCEVLPILAANQNTPSIMFFGNNAGGSEEMIRSLGRERVLLGFPGAAGICQDDRIRFLILDKGEQPTTIGEIDGAESERIKVIASALKDAGFPVSISTNMDAWLKTHVAEIIPTAGALYMANEDIGQLKHNREALGLMIRAIREGFRVLSSLDIPITPSIHQVFRWIPEFLLVAMMRRKLNDKAWSVKIGHASNARDEVKAIAREFRQLAQQSGIATPALDQLQSYVDATERPADSANGSHVGAPPRCP